MQNITAAWLELTMNVPGHTFVHASVMQVLVTCLKLDLPRLIL